MKTIDVIARFKIRPGKLDEFKDVQMEKALEYLRSKVKKDDGAAKKND